MTYAFPDHLIPLRNYLRSQGLTGDSIKTSRQAAFMAQQLLGTRIKFPPPGADMTSTLWLIQNAVPGHKPVSRRSEPVVDLLGGRPCSSKRSKQARSGKAGKSRHQTPQPEYITAFDPDLVKAGYHVFADGACVPNPGPGGWGFAVYRDGEEIASECGGEPEATNNSMELTALLHAIRWALRFPAVAITVWSDSQYSVKGVNEWRHGWRRNGWQRGSDKAEPKNRILLNAGLWQEIDEALSDPRAANVRVCWVKGHAGHVGNERADELAEIGRQGVDDASTLEDLDAEYRAVMAG